MHAHITELKRLGDEIAELSAHLDAATARLLDLLREFDARGGWIGARSCAEWLSWRVGLDLGAARERVRVARALGGLPRSPGPWRAASCPTPRCGRSRGSPRRRPRRGCWRWDGRGRRPTWRRSCGGGGTSIGRWRPDAEARHRGRPLQVYTDEDGMVVVRGRLTPEAGAVLVRALEAGRETLYAQGRAARRRGSGRSPTRRRTASSRRTRWRWWRRRRWSTGSTPNRGASATRSWSTWTPRCWPTPPSRASRSWRTARSFRGNFPPPGVRGDAGGAAPRGGRLGARHGAADADDPAGAAAGAGGAGPRVSLPGLRGAPRPGPSRPPLGQRRADAARQPRASLRPASPGGPRGGLHGGADRRRHAPLQHAAGPADSRSAGPAGGAARAHAGPRGDEPGARSRDRRADGAPELVRRAAGPRLGDRRPASRSTVGRTPTGW